MIRLSIRDTHLQKLDAGPIVSGVAYYCAAMISLFLTRSGDGIATLWPPSGLLLAALLVSSRKNFGLHLVAAATASLAANLGADNPPLTSIGFTLANVTESGLTAWLLRTFGTRRLSFTDFGELIRFCLVAIVGTTTSATIAVLAAASPSIKFWFSWFSTDLLGMLIVTPLLLIVGGTLQGARPSSALKTAPEAIVVFGLVALVAGLSFWEPAYPLLFLPMLAVIFAALRLGPLGAAGGVLIVAVLGSLAATNGIGPRLPEGSGPVEVSLFLQFYLLMLFVAALPIAALLAARRRLMERLAEKMRLLELAEGASQVGHWRLDIETQAVTWSSEVFRIFGVSGHVAPLLAEAIDAFHPDDRAMVTAHIERSIAQRSGFAFTARIVRPDGTLRHVLSRGEIDEIEDGGAFGLFGITRDITTEVEHAKALEAARLRAEEMAQTATIMAETDALTGLANRRRTTALLDDALVASRRTGQPVSVAIFDIDHFKRVNDTYGHQAGDEVLKRVAGDASGKLRGGDTVGRFGGEEFVVVLPDASAQTALNVLERVRRAIEDGDGDPSVTISIGVAERSLDEGCDSLLRRADQALYVAKREGRNTIRVAA